MEDMEHADEKTKIDMVNRTVVLVPLRDVIEVVKKNFNEMHDQLPNRNPMEQHIIGGFITSLELEIKKGLKELQKE